MVSLCELYLRRALREPLESLTRSIIIGVFTYNDVPAKRGEGEIRLPGLFDSNGIVRCTQSRSELTSGRHLYGQR